MYNCVTTLIFNRFTATPLYRYTVTLNLFSRENAKTAKIHFRIYALCPEHNPSLRALSASVLRYGVSDFFFINMIKVDIIDKYIQI